MITSSGELEKLGFEEVEPGLVADTTANRRRVYMLDGGWQYERILDENGAPTGLIRPLRPEVVTARRESNLSVYEPLLVDPGNPWSDYVGPDEFPMDAYAPYWVFERLSKWRRAEREGVPEDERVEFPVRCTHVRHDGTRCWLWASKPSDVTVCSNHLKVKGTGQERYAQIAKIKLMEMAPDAVDNLERLALFAEGEAVRLKANTEILDRAGVRGGVEIDIEARVEQTDPGELIRSRLGRLAERIQSAERAAIEAASPTDIVDAEVVETHEAE